MSVSQQELRDFAQECMRWADEADNASQRDIMVQIARIWINAANSIDLYQSAGAKLRSDDLRRILD